MEHILHALANYQITPWKAIGFIGAVMFASRWFVQFYATRKHKRVTMPLAFWVLSICGSVLVLAYFIFGKNDSVGIVQNLFPALVAVYNLIVHVRHPDVGKSGGAPA
ncbi:MAG: lipid-A-disaccharide synthase N-terminal domain-containing protein [Rhodanobacteraceae bacterium]